MDWNCAMTAKHHQSPNPPPHPKKRKKKENKTGKNWTFFPKGNAQVHFINETGYIRLSVQLF
jgi:hypothetical protein